VTNTYINYVTTRLTIKIKQRAKLLQKPEEKVIRELLAQRLLISKPWHNAGEALRTLSELEIVGPADLAKNHDDEYRHPET
jgi:hypothetical protein